MNFLLGKVEGSLMVGPPGIHNNTMNSASLGDNLVHCSSDAIFLGDIGLESKHTAGIPAAHGSKFIAGLANVDGVNLGCAVVEAAFGDAETNSAVCAGDGR